MKSLSEEIRALYDQLDEEHRERLICYAELLIAQQRNPGDGPCSAPSEDHNPG